MHALRVRFRHPVDKEMEVEAMNTSGCAKKWHEWFALAAAKGMRTVGELQAYLAARKNEAKKPRSHCIEKYEWRTL